MNSQIESVLGEQTHHSKGPKVGSVQDGYRFKGGDPANPSNWEKTDGWPWSNTSSLTARGGRCGRAQKVHRTLASAR